MSIEYARRAGDAYEYRGGRAGGTSRNIEFDMNYLVLSGGIGKYFGEARSLYGDVGLSIGAVLFSQVRVFNVRSMLPPFDLGNREWVSEDWHKEFNPIEFSFFSRIGYEYHITERSRMGLECNIRMGLTGRQRYNTWIVEPITLIGYYLLL